MFKPKNLPLTISTIVVISLIIGWGISMVLAWEDPTASPPGGNVSAPINVSSTEQTKTGILGADGGFEVDGYTAISGSNQVHYTYFGGSYVGFGSPAAGVFAVDAAFVGPVFDTDFEVTENDATAFGNFNVDQELFVTGILYADGGIQDNNDATVNIGENLDVSGNLSVSGTITGTLTAAGGWVDDNGNVRLSTSTDSVGIGTAGPAEKLHVEGNVLIDAYNQGTEKGIFFREGFTSSNIYNVSILTYDDGDASPDALQINAFDGVYFNTGSNTRNVRMIINTLGNVGIGTTGPSNKLDVRPFTTGGSDTIGTGGISLGSDNPYWTFRISATPLADLTFDRLYAGTDFEAMRIQRTTGNVGIGTTDPKQELHIEGSLILAGEGTDIGVANGNNLQIGTWNADYSTYTNWMTILNTSGNVGIGITNPGEKLHVVGNGLVDGNFYVDTDSGVNAAYITRLGSATQGLKIYASDRDLYTRYIEDGGEVSPGTWHFINERDGAESYEFMTAQTDGDLILTPTTGNVGIGTTNPGEKLDVLGNIVASGTICDTGGSNCIGGGATDCASCDDRFVNYDGDTMTGTLTFSGNGINLNRSASTRHGINWYSSAYTAWSEYMCAQGATGCGPWGNITAPTGTIVTSWALRSFIENAAGYGWTWESGTSTGQPSVVAELRSSDGSMKLNGIMRADGGFEVDGTTAISASNQVHYTRIGATYVGFGSSTAGVFGVDAAFVGPGFDADFEVTENDATAFGIFNVEGILYANGGIQDFNDATVNVGESLAVSGDLTVSGGDMYLPTSRISDSVSTSYLNIRPQNNRMILYDNVNNMTFDIYNGGTRGVHLAGSGDSYINGGNFGIGTTAPASLLHLGVDGEQIRVGTPGGGRSAVMGSKLNNIGGGTNEYAAYFAYDAYFDDSDDTWKPVRTNLGNKWKMEMGYHTNDIRFSYSSGYSPISWSDLVTINSSGNITATGTICDTGGSNCIGGGATDCASCDGRFVNVSGDTMTGNLTVSGTTNVNGGLSQDGNVILNGTDTWLRTTGATGWYNSTYGGGWYMTDSTYVKPYNSKAIDMNNQEIINIDWANSDDGSGSGLDADLLDGINPSTSSTANTIAVRNGSGDINARLFRSEYDSTNATINYIMTQIDTVSNNYIRPSTPAQLATALTSSLETYFLRSNTSDTMSGNLTVTDNLTVGGRTFTNFGSLRTFENVAYYYNGNTINTGTIVITIGSTPNVMLDAEITIQGYGGLTECRIRGYTYTGSTTWHQPAATCISSGHSGGYTVRFGKRASDNARVILIGTTGSGWGNYPHVLVKRVTIGYPGSGTALGDWSISIVANESAYTSIVNVVENSTFYTDKLYVGTIDPIYEIDGIEYATYVSDFAGGVRTETSGVLELDSENKYVIDFEDLETGSDLWLFWETSTKEIDDLVVIPAPGFDGRIWYEKEGSKLVIYGDKPGEVSYRLTLPRLDDEEWGNIAEEEE